MLTAPLLMLAALLPVSGLLAQQDPARQGPAAKDPRLSAAAETEAAARLARIRDEVAKPGDDPAWAGSYYRGDGTGVNVYLELAPRSGFVFTWRGCLGVCDRNYGAVADNDGLLELTFTFPNPASSFQALAPVLVPVRWGGRRYLIARDDMPGFANAINGGSEPRDGVHGSTLLRVGDEKKPVQGRPELPKEIAALLLDEPVVGTILAIHSSRIETRDKIDYRVSEATIDRGEQHGLRRGHVVHFTERNFSFAGPGAVIEVGRETSRIRIRGLSLEKMPVPEAGWKWSTRWNVAR